jgi:putative NADPH-quinone reductase
MSAPIKTFLKENILEDKKLVVFTTANIDIKKYDKFDDDAPFFKRLLRDYLRKSSKGMRLLAKDSGAEIIKHYHVETKDVTREQIIEQTLDHFADLQLNTDLKRCTTLH